MYENMASNNSVKNKCPFENRYHVDKEKSTILQVFVQISNDELLKKLATLKILADFICCKRRCFTVHLVAII